MELRFTNLGVATVIITCLLAGTTNAFITRVIGSGCAKENIPGQWQHTEDGMIWDFIDSEMPNGFEKFRRIIECALNGPWPSAQFHY